MADPASPPPAAPPAGNPPAAAPPAEESSLLGSKAPPAAAPPAAAPPAKPGEAPAKPEEKKADPPPEIKLELPKDSKLTQADVDRIKLFANANGLSQKQAETMLSEEAKVAEERTKGEQQAFAAARQKAFADNRAALKADPEIGGDKLARALESADIALRTAPQSVQDLVRKNPIGDHPDIVRWLAKMGEGMREDGTLTGGTGGERGEAPAQSIAQRWYDPSTVEKPQT